MIMFLAQAGPSVIPMKMGIQTPPSPPLTKGRNGGVDPRVKPEDDKEEVIYQQRLRLKKHPWNIHGCFDL